MKDFRGNEMSKYLRYKFDTSATLLYNIDKNLKRRR
jgi:hypothetical protein